MNSQLAIYTIAIIILGYFLLRVIASWNTKGSENIILTLALLASSGVLMAMGSIEMAGRYGYSMIIALFAFSLVFVIAPLVLFPIRRLSNVIRLATSVDFLTFRYRGRKVAIAATIATILAIVPLIFAQLLAVSSVINIIFNSDMQIITLVTMLGVVGLICHYTIKSGAQSNLRLILATAGALLLVALAISAWISIGNSFGGLEAMDSWVILSGQQETIKRLDTSYSLFIIFLAAGLSFPTNFNVLVTETITDRQASMTSWAYPLIILLACIPLYPMLWSGLNLESSSSFQEYLFALPIMMNQPVVASLSLASILLLSIAVCSSLTILGSRMILNSMILPDKNLTQQINLSYWITRTHLALAVGLMLFFVTLSLSIKSRSIIDLYLVGFSGLAQLTPGLIAAMYLPKANRKGFIAGLIGGMFLWLISLALPLIFGDWEWQIPIIGKSLLFGMQAWEVWAIEALLLNITLCTLFSIFTKMDEKENTYASICMADNVYIPIRVELGQKTVEELTQKLFFVLGEDANIEVKNALETLGFDADEARPAALRQIRDTINASLNMRLGVLTTENVMSEAFPPPKSLSNQPEDLFVLESVLAVHGNQLTGIASELNKLRVHHREILDKLPIGIVSLDQNGEILKWNEAISEYTNLDNSSAFGSSIADLPEPWNKEITGFVASDDIIRDNVSMELNGKRRWFTFQKSTGVPIDDINDEVILLIEEKTESVLLIQKSINNERLASVGRLAAGVAHEIGNPVTGIACLAQNLEHESDSKQVLETAEHILSQTSRINRIVESLINFSRGEKSIIKNLQRVNLHEVAEETIQLLTLGDNASQVQFKANIPSDFEILGDYHQLIQVFLNLLSNSRDASTADSEVTILATEADGKIRITINDSGTGITQSLQSQLFEPFVTSKDPGKGTGLGLWVVFNLVKGLDGDITINSPAENNTCGTTVALTFNKPENQA